MACTGWGVYSQHFKAPHLLRALSILVSSALDHFREAVLIEFFKSPSYLEVARPPMGYARYDISLPTMTRIQGLGARVWAQVRWCATL